MLYGAFLLGLLGSLHCLGMCAPIALLASGNPKSHVIAHRFLYNGGRIITYAIMGTVMGLASSFINISNYQSWLSIGLGVSLIFLVFVFPTSRDVPKISIVSIF